MLQVTALLREWPLFLVFLPIFGRKVLGLLVLLTLDR